jgi:formate hydrogenlyase subunit 3/multisubunit Na+/H+ antiporter MnhD subunit
MTVSPSTPLKLGAVAFAVLLTLWMLWWSGSLDRVNVAMLTICGAAAGYLWYLAMRWLLARVRLDAVDESTDAPEAPRGKIYPWIVWAALMVGTGIATAGLLDLVDPWIPAGDQHRLISALFIVVVWPSLMWCLPLLLKRRFPV